MKLTDSEKAMLDGAEGRAVRKAMDLLVRYGEALGAERSRRDAQRVWRSDCAFAMKLALVETRGLEYGLNAGFSEMNLDSDEVIEVPRAKVYTCQLIQRFGPDTAALHDGPREILELQEKSETSLAPVASISWPPARPIR